MEFPSPEISDYLLEITPERNALLKEMEALAEEQMFPAVGPLVGRFLYQLAKISEAKMIFELGSGFAYSTLWFAMAIPENGQIIATDFDRKKADLGLKFLDRAKLRHKVLYEVGDALNSFHRYQGPFDLIFVDLNKEQYPKALEMAVPRLKKGGLLVADNVLWSGRILDKKDRTPATEGIRKFNEGVYHRPELFPTIIPLRDGVMVAIKE
jgi:predicted O-methyltransferase YrrM